MIRILLAISLLLFLFEQSLVAQDQFLVHGKITDVATGEPLIGCHIQLAPGNYRTISDEEGKYHLSVPAGEYHLSVSYLGYESVDQTLIVSNELLKNLALKQQVVSIEHVDINAKKGNQNITSDKISSITINRKEIDQLPAFFGEPDIIKAIKLTPGIQSGGEGNSGLFVRGGDAGQNLILLDQMPIYNPSHLLGFFSVFNSDAIEKIELMKGGMPATYGGRASSVIDIDMKEGAPDNVLAKGSVGFITSDLTIESPIVKGKSSVIVSGRQAYLGFIRSIVVPMHLSSDNFFNTNQYNFYDLNLKFFANLSRNDRIYLTGYFGNDNYRMHKANFQLSNSMTWGNLLAGLRWNHLFNERLSSNTMIGFTGYHFNLAAAINQYQFELASQINDLYFKSDFICLTFPRQLIKFGINYTHHELLPNQVEANLNLVSFNNKLKYYSHESSAYLNDAFTVSDQLSVNAGLRFTNYIQTGPYQIYVRDDVGMIIDSTVYGSHATVKTYNTLEPRISANYQLNSYSAIKGSFGINKQFIHLISVGSVSMPSDIWLPSTKFIKPQSVTQYAVGYFRNFNENVYESSVEVYYKRMNNQIEFKNGMFNTFYNTSMEENLVFGKGQAFGIEFFLKKQIGTTTGWFSYTLSRTLRQFNEINNGKPFPAKYDRIHDLSITLTHKLNERWTLSSVFIFTTGNAMNLPTGRYMIQGNIVNDYTKTNSFRMPAYHRLDLSANYTLKKNRFFESSLNFAVYNVYNRANPYYIYFQAEGDLDNYQLEVKPKQIELFPILPSVTWNLTF